MTRRLPLVAVHAALAALLASAGAAADDVTFQGYVDVRAVAADDTRTWTDGGLGKTRWGDDSGVHFGGAALAASWQMSPSLLAFAEVQLQEDAEPAFDLQTAYLRWRPVSTTRWRFGLRGGVFFPPVSLENDGIGWTSRWTLSPSAINTWVGEELRGTGLEGQLEWRGDRGTWSATGAFFGHNEPAGELIASRGWAIGDFTTGYGGRLRQPDVYAPVAFADVPMGFSPFQRIAGAIGGWAEVRYASDAFGTVTAMHYDNRADPEAYLQFDDRRLFAWHTKFDAIGASHRFGDVQLVAQWMDGTTAFEPVEELYLASHFDSAFVLAAWERGAWRPAVRIERFRVRQTGGGNPLDEDGHAVTVALNWRPTERWRFTAEWLRINSERTQHLPEGLPVDHDETQLQLSARFLF